MKTNYYQKRKEQVRSEAVEFSLHCHEIDDFCELNRLYDYFYKMGKRYGLLREFHENAIC